MCAILDANCFSKFRDQDNEDMKPVELGGKQEWQNYLHQY